jgi:ribosomal protein S12 methylthiotransferase accessory factor
MSIMIQHHEDVRFSAHFGRHQVPIDLPESHGGQDSGMAPPQLFIAALGACAGVYTADHCDSQGIGYQGMHIELDWAIEDRPRRIGSVRVRIRLPDAALAPAQRAGIQASVQDCLLRNTLAHPPRFEVEVTGREETAAIETGSPRCDTGVCCRPAAQQPA